MKLLFCPKCWDVFKLANEPRACKCGKVTGQYTDSRYAETNGKGVSLAIGNGSLLNAIMEMNQLQKSTNDLAGRRDYIGESPIIAWVRPNEGNGNPHTKIKE